MPALKSHVLEMFSSSVKKWELATQGKANWKTTPRLLKATSIASSHRPSGKARAEYRQPILIRQTAELYRMTGSKGQED
jgi:hypothetical protein